MTLSAPRAATDADFPQDAPVAEQLEAMLNWAVLAPSVLNTQPWIFAMEDGAVLLFADRARQLATLDPHGRELAISCGAALFNLRLAARHFGYATRVERTPDPDQPDLLARIRLAGAERATEEHERLFREIKHRRTNRRPFAEMPVPSGLLRDLQEAVVKEGAQVLAITDPGAKAEIGALVAAGVRAQGADPDAASEIHRWLRPNRDPRRDGVPDREQAGWDRVSTLRSDATIYARQLERLAATAPALLLLTTEADGPEAWIRAGEALQHVLLLAARHDVSASYLNQPVEIEPLRKQLAALAGEAYPQVVFRIGYTVDAAGTPRRAVGDVMTSVPPQS
ncbi:MAG: nitroreductase family protein [Bacteroidota bacterium]